MLFRKKMKLTDFLEGPLLESVLLEGSFRHTDFHEAFHAALARELGDPDRQPISRERFEPTFMGAFLWLLKYRTLSTNRNSPRKLAFLDMLFDIEMPRLIYSRMKAFDTERMREIYDRMDVGCKKVYTGEVISGEPPPFLVSPIWEKDADPHPFKTAATVLAKLLGYGTTQEEIRATGGERFTDELMERFIVMTEPVAKSSARLNFTWAAPKEGQDPPQAAQ